MKKAQIINVLYGCVITVLIIFTYRQQVRINEQDATIQAQAQRLEAVTSEVNSHTELLETVFYQGFGLNHEQALSLIQAHRTAKLQLEFNNIQQMLQDTTKVIPEAERKTLYMRLAEITQELLPNLQQQ